MSFKDAQDLVTTHGNVFHCKVINAFRDKGWAVTVSPYYVDPATDKARELDLIAEKDYPVEVNSIQLSKGRRRSIRVRLFVECKYVEKTSVFWFDYGDTLRTKDLLISETKFDDSTYTHGHHYLKQCSSVAKLFATEKSGENDPIYRALSQCLHGYLHTKDRAVPDPSVVSHVLPYPVVIFSAFSSFYRVGLTGSSDPRSIDDHHFLLEADYAYVDSSGQHRNRCFLVDFVDFKSLDTYSTCLEDDARCLMRVLNYTSS